MTKIIKNYFRENGVFMLASFFIPFLILAAVYLSIGIYPGSDRSVLASDAFSQFSNFHASFRNMLTGETKYFLYMERFDGVELSLADFLLSWWNLYTACPFLPNQLMPDAPVLFDTDQSWFCRSGLLVSCAAHVQDFLNGDMLLLSVSYALTSFVTAHSAIIMWLDAFVYLPLVTLGIHLVMDQKRPVLLFVSYLLLFLSSFYMGFMVGVFSFLYFLARLFTKWECVQKIDPALRNHFSVSWRRIDDHYFARYIGFTVKW
jgi:uncharacterized membrane protein YfhO